MDWLLETRLLVWLATEPERVSPEARALIEDPGAKVWVSAASLWFDTVRVTSVDRRPFGRDRSRRAPFIRENFGRDLARAAGYLTLEVTQRHAEAIGDLPQLHSDPLERLLIAQARVEGLTLLTPDETLARYGEGVRLV